MRKAFRKTISQNVDIQAYMVLRLIRNGLDDLDPMTGIAFPDEAGNVVPDGNEKSGCVCCPGRPVWKKDVSSI
jgi:hypothetical protein